MVIATTSFDIQNINTLKQLGKLVIQSAKDKPFTITIQGMINQFTIFYFFVLLVFYWDVYNYYIIGLNLLYNEYIHVVSLIFILLAKRHTPVNTPTVCSCEYMGSESCNYIN